MSRGDAPAAAAPAAAGAVDAPGRTGGTALAGAPAPARHRGAFGRLLWSELRLTFRRRRSMALLAGLAAVPLLLGLVLLVAQDTAISGQGPGFVGRVTGNGLFLVVAALFLCLPFLLPLTTGIATADAISGEAHAGTLRYLLTVPVARTRLLLVKAVATVLYVGAAVLAIALVALVTGAALFGVGEVTLLSGTSVPAGEGVLRMAGVTTHVALSLTGLVAVGLFISTLTEVPIGAMAATVVFAVVSAVLDTLPQLAAIHPALLTHHWLDMAEFLRISPDWSLLGQGLAVQGAYVAVFGALAWARFTTADITA